MKSRYTPYWVIALLFTVCFSLASVIQPRASSWTHRSAADSVLSVLLGDGRRLFSNHFFVQADVSFHSGYYPSIFDQKSAPKDSQHLTSGGSSCGHLHGEGEACSHEEERHEGAEPDHDHSECSHDHSADHGDNSHGDSHERAMAFLDKPRDWIEAFGRRFMITDHTHLEAGKEREMLPYLKVSAELDPQRVETYTVAAYWLRSLGRVDEAERFLRDGLRANPDSYEILFELGRVYREARQDIERSRNVWELALQKWEKKNSTAKDPDLHILGQIAIHLGRMEETQGRYERALSLLRLAQKASPTPEMLATDINALEKKLQTPTAPTE